MTLFPRNPDGTLDWRDRVEVIRGYARRSGYRIFVETGTGEGATLALLVDDFDHLHSIEIGVALYLGCLKKFAGNAKVRLYYGDSGAVLPSVIPALGGRAIFWVDAHDCGGARGDIATPVREELLAILRLADTPIILIDDIRLFGKEPDYPSVQWIEDTVRTESRCGHEWSLYDDILRVVPRDPE
jgi:hypothetical protein